MNIQFSDRYRAPENIGNDGESCHFCGNRISPGEIVVEAEIGHLTEYAHASCLEAAEQDAAEMQADELRDEQLREEGVS